MPQWSAHSSNEQRTSVAFTTPIQDQGVRALASLCPLAPLDAGSPIRPVFAPSCTCVKWAGEHRHPHVEDTAEMTVAGRSEVWASISVKCNVSNMLETVVSASHAAMIKAEKSLPRELAF